MFSSSPGVPLWTLCLIAFSGCVDPGYDTPTDEVYDEIAVASAKTVTNESGGDAASMGVVAEISIEGDLPWGFDEVDGMYSGTFLGLTYRFGLSCLDAAGLTNDCGPGTDGAQAEVLWSGSLDTARYDADFDRSGEWTLSNLSTLDPTFDGSSRFVVDTRFDGIWVDATSQYHLEYEALYNDIHLDPLVLLPYSGDISYTLYADRFAAVGDDSVSNRYRIAVEIAFVGPALAMITLDGDHAYELDLDTGDLVPLD